jgi:hypothetical protein
MAREQDQVEVRNKLYGAIAAAAIGCFLLGFFVGYMIWG